MTAVAQLAERIIKEQELIIGPLAWREAKKVKGLTIKTDGDVRLLGDAKKVLGDLVKQYEKMFGPASREVCREAVRGLTSKAKDDELPEVLK